MNSRQPLASKYRPNTWEDVVEQDNTKVILQQQLDSGGIRNAYLFCGGAGTGKTTCARIFAQEINKHEGSPIEMDAADNSSVNDVRDIIQQARMKSIDSEYKIFIIDECHSLSGTAWQAFLKLLEEPPAKSVFIFCTTEMHKIPRTILSRVQRYDFKRISQQGIVDRLDYILENERDEDDAHDMDALEYLAKLAEGGLRDAITLMDKCLSFSKDLTLENVLKVLGTVDYSIMEKLTDAIIDCDRQSMIDVIESIHMDGKDLKQFMRSYMTFILDVCKYQITKQFDYISIPQTEKKWLEEYHDVEPMLSRLSNILDIIKYDSNPKTIIEIKLLLLMEVYK